MFNFLDPKFAPKVICKSPSTDNYDVDNLISNDYNDKIRGFICYPSIKPPVEVEFEFICPVNVHYIVINTTVGSQRCSGIELFAKTDDSNYITIGKCIYNEAGVLFCNSRKYSKTKLPENYSNNFHQSFFKSNTFRHFLNATGIKISIFRTDKSVPCIGSVEVWGTPSRNCSQVTVNTINRIARKDENPELSISVKSEEFEIPEDFKDDLTCEIMTLPMTLPSGHTVDQTTLDKHIQNEKSFARKPCDPFTGIKFNESLKPVLNVGLKSRIDMFILQNSHRKELSNIRRTLGGSVKNFPEKTSQKRIRISGDSDLEEAVANAKRTNSFMSFTSDESYEKKCVICKLVTHFLYKLTCDHFYCRSCLMSVCGDLKCSVCSASFVRDDVQKCNF